MILKIFTQPSCPNCPPAKKLGKDIEKKENGTVVEWYDVTEAEGLAEAAFYSVMATPSLVLLDDKGKEVKTWRGETPKEEEIAALSA